jgi:ABC-type multidrug transport system ATPase subunit
MAQYVFTMNRVGKIVPPKRHILKDISLSFFPGAKIGVLGTNGSGKSTLLKIAAGIVDGRQGFHELIRAVISDKLDYCVRPIGITATYFHHRINNSVRYHHSKLRCNPFFS